MSYTVDDPVSLGDIADRLGTKVNVVVNWSNRHEDFPDPIFETKAGRIYEWADVAVWHEFR